MIEQKALKLSDRKRENSIASSNFQSASKKNSSAISRTKTEVQIIRKTGKTSKVQEDTSVGAQKLMNPVPKCIERRSNSDKAINRLQKNIDFGSCKNKSFQENSNLRRGNRSTLRESDKYYSNNVKLTQPTPKKPERTTENKNKIAEGGARKTNQTDKCHQAKFAPTAKRSAELKQINTQSENSCSFENKKHKETVSKEQKSKCTDSNKKKPSEIPLRKTRIDATRKPEVSMLLEKPVKEVESPCSIDFYSSTKPFSPIDEVSICSQSHITIKDISSSEKFKNIDTIENSEKLAVQENVFNVRLERSYKSANIPLVANAKSTKKLLENDLSEEKSSPGKKTKLLDLEKVKTSSFTVLQSSPFVLNRLESLHKQNVLAKKKVNPGNLKKPKPLTPIQLFNSIKRRNSRRSLSSRVSNVKNKSNLKLKGQNSKKEIQEDLCSPEKLMQLKINATPLNLYKELLEDRKVISDNREGGRRTNQVLNKNISKEKEDGKSLLPKSVRHEDKSSLQKVKSCREKEESKIPTPQKFSTPKTSFEATENSAVANEVESVGCLKSKTHMPISPSSNSDQNQIKLKIRRRKQKEDAENFLKVSTMSESRVSSISSKCNDECKNIDQPVEVKISREQEERRLTENETPKAKNEFFARDSTCDSDFGEIQEKKENSKKKVKMQIKIDLNLQDSSEENSKNKRPCDWLFKNGSEEPGEELPKEQKVENSLLPEWTGKKEKINPRNLSEVNLGFRETSIDCPEELLDKIPILKTKEIRKKVRSDAGDRSLPSFGSFFNPNLPLKDKSKNSPIKSYNKDEKREIFEKEIPVKLRRRNSEPISLTGYVWKRTNFSFFRGDKPSMSSVASSLRHLNTDDFDDFIFWEPATQKMASCWEMSLYQLKKPWSVLSCSVFRDNRLSNTPGQILENLRNGGNPNIRQSSGGNRERLNCAKENPFDVEPSIAQKNIDIRNWLAALNFPTSTSNSPDVISEGNFTSQSPVDSRNPNKAQVTPKRKKVFRNLKYVEKAPKFIPKGKNMCIGRNLKEEESIRGLVRRKSGGYIINELLNSKYLTHRLKLSPCLASKSAEGNSLLLETDDRNTASESKVFKKQAFYSESGTMVDESLCCSNQLNEYQSKISKKSDVERNLKEKQKNLSPEFNIWKYLFIFTIFIIFFFYFNDIDRNFIHYC